MKKFLLSLLLIVCLGASAAFAADKLAYTIEFKSNTNDGVELTANNYSDQITSGSNYISSATDISKVYAGKNGLKFSSSSANGKITFNLTNKITITKIVINGAAWKANEACSLNINEQSVSFNSSNTNLSEYVYSFTSTEPTSQITLEATKRLNVKSISVYGEEVGTDPIEVHPTFPSTLYADTDGKLAVAPEDFFEGISNLEIDINDENVITIEEDGTYLTGDEGSTSVTMTWKDGSKYLAGKATFTVTVEKAPDAVVINRSGVKYTGSVKDVKDIDLDGLTLTYPNVVSITFSGGTNNSVAGYSESFRVYSATMTFTPAKDIIITKIVFKNVHTTTPTITVAGNNGEISTDNNKVTTWTGASENAIVISTSAQTRIPNFEIYYTKKAVEPGKTEVKLAWSADNATATIGQEFVAPTLSVDVEDAKEFVEYISSNDKVADIDEEGNLEIFANGTTTITAFISDENKEYTAYPVSYKLTVIDPNCLVINPEFFGYNGTAYAKKTQKDDKGVTYEAVFATNSGNMAFNPNNNNGKASAIVVTGNDNGVIIESITINFTSTDLTFNVYTDWNNFEELTLGQEPTINPNLEPGIVKAAENALSQTIEIGTTAFAIVPQEKNSRSIESIEVKYSDKVIPTTLYLHGHFFDRYFDLSQPLPMTKEGTRFVIWQVLMGSEGTEFAGYDPEYVFTTHCLPAAAPASAKRRASGVHASNWADLTEGKVYDASGTVKNAADVTSESDLQLHSVPEAGKFYDFSADFSDPENPRFYQNESRLQTGVEGVSAEPVAVKAEYYDMMGHRVAKPATGVYIRVVNGTATKVMINE